MTFNELRMSDKKFSRSLQVTFISDRISHTSYNIGSIINKNSKTFEEKDRWLTSVIDYTVTTALSRY